jgi:hypothetical protein
MTKTNLLVDVGIFTAFLISSSPHMTGNLIHEWLGVALAIALIFHILLHWNWIISVGHKFFKALWQVSRLRFVMDMLIFVAFITLIASGLIMSKNVMSTLGIQFTAGRSWKMIHSTASNAAAILTGIHIALNWSWVTCMAKKCVLQPILSIFHPGLKSRPAVIEILEGK